MIIGAMRGKDLICFLGKYVREVLTPFGQQDFCGLGVLSKLCRQGNLLNRLFV